jgi:hypothetical protein
MSEEKTTHYSSLPSPIDLVKESWKIYSDHILYFITLMAIPFFAGMIIMGLSLFLGWVTGPSLVVGIILSVITFVLFFLVQIWGQTGLLMGVMHYEKKETYTALYKNAWGILGVFFLTSMLSAFVILGGMMLFILPGIFFVGLLAFSSFILIQEKKTFFEALMQSAKYVSGRWWSVFGRILFLIALAIVVSDGVAWLFGLISPVAGDVISGGLTFALVPFFVLYAYQLFVHVKKTYTPSEESVSISRPWFIGFAVFGLLGPAAMVLIALLVL